MTRRLVLFGALALAGGCGDQAGLTLITGPFTTNVVAARAAWLSHQPASYAFEFSMQALEWGPQGPYSRVVVQNGVAVEWSDSQSGTVAPETIEEHWQRILTAHANGSLKAAQFTQTGIPVEWLIDVDSMADDSYKVWIRSFEKR